MPGGWRSISSPTGAPRHDGHGATPGRCPLAVPTPGTDAHWCPGVMLVPGRGWRTGCKRHGVRPSKRLRSTSSVPFPERAGSSVGAKQPELKQAVQAVAVRVASRSLVAGACRNSRLPSNGRPFSKPILRIDARFRPPTRRGAGLHAKAYNCRRESVRAGTRRDAVPRHCRGQSCRSEAARTRWSCP